MPYNIPTPKGEEIFIPVYANANLGHGYVIERSVTVTIMMLNKTHFDKFSKE